MKDLVLANQYSGILGIAPDDESNGPSFVCKLVSDGVVENKQISLLLQRKPLSSYITFGGKTDNMMHEVNGTYPINWYSSTSKTKWKLRVRDTLIRDQNNTWTFYNLD